MKTRYHVIHPRRKEEIASSENMDIALALASELSIQHELAVQIKRTPKPFDNVNLVLTMGRPVLRFPINGLCKEVLYYPRSGCNGEAIVLPVWVSGEITKAVIDIQCLEAGENRFPCLNGEMYFIDKILQQLFPIVLQFGRKMAIDKGLL